MRRLLFACALAVAAVTVVGCEDIGPTGDPVDVSYRPCTGSSLNPTWLAVQDGDASWERITPAAGSYNFTIRSGRAGFAIFDDDGLLVIYATTEQLQSILGSCTSPVRDVTGTVTGYTSADRVRLTMGGELDNDDFPGSSFPAPTAWGIAEVDPAVSDLVAVRYRFNGGTATTLLEEVPNSVLLRRGVTGTSTSTVDLSSATEAFAPIARELAVSVISGEALLVRSYAILPTTFGRLGRYESQTIPVSGTATAPFYGVPSTRLNAGESQLLRVSAVKTVGSASEARTVAEVFTNPVDRTITLGASLGAVTVTGTSRPTATYTVQSEYDNLFQATFTQTGAQVSVLASKDYLGAVAGSSVTLAVPNLTGVAGFDAAWLLAPGQSSSWLFLATDAPFALLSNPAVSYRGAERAGNFTP